MGTVGKAQPGHDADHSPHLMPRSKTSFELYLLFRLKRLQGVYRGQLYFIIINNNNNTNNNKYNTVLMITDIVVATVAIIIQIISISSFIYELDSRKTMPVAINY
jgi:hypothetical protein